MEDGAALDRVLSRRRDLTNRIPSAWLSSAHLTVLLAQGFELNRHHF